MGVTTRNILVAFLAATALAACARTAPIYNVSGMPIQASKPNPSVDEVGKAIARAGAGLGWQIMPVKPGAMVGTLQLRDHVAVVDITYDAKAYNISYKNSNNLNYDGQNIHKNYNGWIQNLDRAIKVQLSTF